MLTWMIYAVSVSAVLSAAALIAEHSARQRGSLSLTIKDMLPP
ncbi:hypothetical protein P3T40_001831 [Paraburkholderia sp. EB58]|jgi:bla regulator protein BlaR1